MITFTKPKLKASERIERLNDSLECLKDLREMLSDNHKLLSKKDFLYDALCSALIKAESAITEVKHSIKPRK